MSLTHNDVKGGSLAKVRRSLRDLLSNLAKSVNNEVEKKQDAPRLLMVDWLRQYNVVEWRRRFYGLPRHLGTVNLEKEDLSKLDGMIKADSLGTLRASLEVMPLYDGPPVLIESVGLHNIVVWRGRFYGIDRRLGAFDLENASSTERATLLEAESLPNLRAAIRSFRFEDDAFPPALVGARKGFNIVFARRTYYAIPQRLGNVDLQQCDPKGIAEILRAETFAEICREIDTVS